MAVLELPLRTDLTHYELSQVLDGVAYVFEFRWNLRDVAWYFDLRLEDGTNVWNGVKVVVDFPIVKPLGGANKPRGLFIAFDSSGKHLDAAIDDLGSRVQLFYYDADSKAELASAMGL